LQHTEPLSFKIDENLSVEVADEFRNNGYNAITVGEQNMCGASDERLADVCCDEKRTMVTLDLDFADIRAYPPQEFPGIIVLRLIRQDKYSVLAAIQLVIRFLSKETLRGYLWIVDEHRIRIRGKSD